MLSFRTCILSFLFGLLLVSCSEQTPKKPNVLFFTTDYHAWEDIPAVSPFLHMPAHVPMIVWYPDELKNLNNDLEYKAVIDSLMGILLESRPWFKDFS